MPAIPRLSALDSSADFRRDPYGFIASRARELGGDLFETRILLQRTICMTGPEAVQLFYDANRFTRRGGNPEPVRATLLGTTGIQNTDGCQHAHRKALFLSFTVPAAIGGLIDRVEQGWVAAAHEWARRGGEVVLFEALQPILTRAVCDWAGVPLPERDLPRRTRELVSLFDEAGDVGLGHLRSRLNRRRANAWLADLVRQARRREPVFRPGSAAHAFATFAEADGRLLRPAAAADEILNLLRPTVAVAVYIVFVAHALQVYPALRDRLHASRDPVEADRFVQEVRRFYPFFPALAAVTRCGFEWRGYPFPANTRVLLDLHGTNHDPRAWADPHRFNPDRFRETSWDRCPFSFVPQGGNGHASHHRCPGEWITVELMKLAVDFLVRRLDYAVPPQDLRIDTQRLPALPRSRMVLRDVRLAGSAAVRTAR